MLEQFVNIGLYVLLLPMCFLVGFYCLFRGSPFASASRQHYLFVNGMLASFFIIALSFFSPKVLQVVLPSWVADIFPLNYITSYWQLLLAIYIFGVSWCLFYLLLGLLSVKHLTDEAIDIATADIASYFKSLHIQAQNQFHGQGRVATYPLTKIRFKHSEDLTSPITWGCLQPVIVLPTAYRHWPQDRVLRVILHEMAHIQRKDWLMKLWVQILCAFMWYLLPVWVFARKIDWFAELACDDTVVKRLDCRAEYAQDLLDIARNRQYRYFALALNQDSQLYLRICAVLDACRSRETWGSYSRNGIAVAVVLVVLFTSTLHASIAEKTALSDRNNNQRYPLVILSPLPQSNPVKPALITRLTKKQNNAEQYIARATAGSQHHLLPQRPSEEVVIVAEQVAKQTPQPLAAQTLGMPPVTVPMPQVTFKGYLPVKMVTPQYPRSALSKGLEGKVIAQFDVNHLGAVENVRIVYAKPLKVFNKSVIRAIKKFKFMPLEFGGQAIKTKNVSETFIFSLKETATDNKTKTQFNGRTEIARSKS